MRVRQPDDVDDGDDGDDVVHEGSRRTYRLKAAILVVLVVAVIVVAFTVDLPDAQPLRDRVNEAGPWGLVIFVLLYAALALTPFPASTLTVASGLLFGLVTGVIVVAVAATLGAWVAFMIARWLGRDGVSRLRWKRVATIDAMLERRGLAAVLIIRLIPLFPFAMVNYAAGLSAVRQRDYVIGTAVGILPATAGYTALGAYGTAPLSWPFLVAVGAVILIAAGSGYVAKRIRRVDHAVTS